MADDKNGPPLAAATVATMQTQVHRRVLRTCVRRSLLAPSTAEEMGGWAHGGGFSLDAAVRIEGADRAGRERLLRYCARPPFALEQMQDNHPNALGGLRAACVALRDARTYVSDRRQRYATWTDRIEHQGTRRLLVHAQGHAAGEIAYLMPFAARIADDLSRFELPQCSGWWGS